MSEKVEKKNDVGVELNIVKDGDMPKVLNEGSINQLAKRFGELAARLDVFEVNNELVYYNHRRDRRPMTGRVFRSWIENHVFVVGGFDRKSGAPLPGSLGLGDSLDVLEAPDFRRGVRRIEQENKVRLPVIREDGKHELLPWGYDAPTGVYTIPGGLEYDLDWDVAQGKKWIEDWFGGMPYDSERSKAVMVAGLLVLFIKHLPGGNGLRPGFLWEANMAGSGKSLCAKACVSAVLGFAPIGKRKSNEEMDKEIEAHIKSKSPVIFLDNLYGSLKSATLDQLITSKVVTFREMGGQSIATLRNDAPIMVTGNELEKNDDAFRRFLQCYLFEKGNPNDRKVAKELDDDVMESDEWRSDALAALWSFVRTWDEKGRPNGETTLGSFEAFSRLIGGIVQACGYYDPMKRPADEGGLSPERADFVAMVRGCYEEMVEDKVKQKLFSLDDLARVARAADVFGEKIGDVEFGVREHIKQEKLTGTDKLGAEDVGCLTDKQRQHWTRLLKSKIGTEPMIDGVKVQFGNKVKEGRKTKFTLMIIE